MMRNSINSYLTTLVMVLALLFSANAFATETVQSTIEIDGKDYTLFTGFTATAGTEGLFGYESFVDNDASSLWAVQKYISDYTPGHFKGGASNPAFVEFYADDAFIPKGYVLDCYQETEQRPKTWTLKARLNEDDPWTVIHSSEMQLEVGLSVNIPVDNSSNNKYKYFRFEIYDIGGSRASFLSELHFYGFNNLSYTHLTVKDATCTEEGIKMDSYYRNDGKYFTDETGAIELDESAVVEPTIPHVGVHHEADVNHIEYWQCSICGKFFSDADLTTEIIEAETEVISYLNYDGDFVRLTEDATRVTSSMTTWDEGWYVVYEDVTIDERITVNGEVYLILANGKTLNANRGITVSTDASFNIYAQTEDETNMGVLNATAPNHLSKPYAGIGGAYGSGDAGSITIYGGKIIARGYEGAGIGSVQYRSVGTITINGGIVDAADTEERGAGIGSGRYGKASVINLNGGVIYAKGIGAGQSGTGSITINISNGIKKIVATSNNSGCIGNKENITVNFKNEGSIVTGVAKDEIFDDSGEGEWRIIRTKALNHHTVIDDDIKAHITVNPEYALAGELITLTLGAAVDASSVKINGGAVSLSDVGEGAYTFVMPDGDVNVAAEVAETYSVDFPEHMEIIRTSNPADGDGKYISGTVVEFRPLFPYTATDVSDGTNMLVASNSVYGVTIGTSNINISATINRESFINLSEATNNFTAVDGDVLSGTTQYTVMVADKANISLSGATINGGIICDGSATITLVGTNNVSGAMNMAGIQVGGEGTTLTIRGNGFLNASGDNQSAGIGLSRAWNPESDVVGGDIVIEGGTITAIGGSEWGAGIGTGVIFGDGRGRNVRVGNITIKGGVVKAIGGEDADGIGTGYRYSGCTNEIGTVTIYDDVDVVDASSIKNGESIIYMHDDIDVSVSKNDYFGIIENGERKIIYTGIPAFDVEDQTYTGETITPKPTVSLGSLNFTEGVDYEYSYSNNVNVGTSATVTVTFKGDYAEFGSVSKSFNITKATPTVEPPTSANPKFAGNCVELVNPGITDFGVILYSIKEDEGYSSDIPCANAAGNYKIYYKVEERDNWSSVEGSVYVSVVNENFTVTFVDAEGETISSDKYPYGTPAERVKLPPENPEKADDEMYAYTFAGWSSEIQDVTGAKTYSPNYDITRIGFGPITIAKDSSSAIIDGMSRDPIDKAIKDCMIKGEVTLYRHFAAGKYSTLVLPFSTFTGAFSGVSFYSFRGVEKENGVWKTVVFGYVDKENEGNKLIEANTPYIVVADADMDDLVVKDGVLFDADDPKSSYGATLTCSEETCDEVPDENKSWQFVGTYNYRQWDSGNNVEEIGTTYGFAGAAGNGGMEIGKFGKIKEGAYIYPMRAYLRYQPPSPPSVLFKAAPAYASVASIDELPESMDVVIRGEEGTTVIGTINTRTGEFRSADNRWFDLNGRYLGNKKPTVKGTYYNNGKKVIVK